MTTPRKPPPGCEHCQPIDVEGVAEVLGLRVSYTRKLLTAGRLPAAEGRLGGHWWWRHDIEALRDARAAGRTKAE